jgi:peptidoglycan hydrolase-like protein with peptidoglycan-binding domain
MTHASAWDWTFPDAQRGDFSTIAKYTTRLWKSAHDKNDPRLDLWMFEFFGQADSDKYVEGYNEYREDEVTADGSHTWHLHGSNTRSKVDSFWGAWATLTVLMGWSVAKWRASLPASDPNSDDKVNPPKPTTPAKPSKLKEFKLGSRVLKEGVEPGTDVAYVQRFAGGPKFFGDDDGIPGPKFTSGVKRYQRDILGFRGEDVDGIVGPKTWAKMGVK